MTQKNLSSNNFDKVIKKTEFDADFESVEKRSKKFIQRKLQVTLLYKVLVLKGEKVNTCNYSTTLSC